MIYADVAVIGGGPAGMSAAVAAKEAEVLVERLQLDDMPHGFGVRGGWIPVYDEWLTGIFEGNE